MAGAFLVVARLAARLTDVPTPATASDKEHIELYYKVRDDLKEQIASADTRATAILTIELALAAALAVLAPIIGDVLSRIAAAYLKYVNASDWTVKLKLVPLGALSIFAAPIALWFLLGTLGACGDTMRVLGSDFRPLDVSNKRWSMVRAMIHPKNLFPIGTEARDEMWVRGSGGFSPFSPYSLATDADISPQMRELKIPHELIRDIQSRAKIAKNKRLALHDATNSLTIQLMASLLLAISLAFLSAVAVQ